MPTGDSDYALIIGQKSPGHRNLETEYPEESTLSHERYYQLALDLRQPRQGDLPFKQAVFATTLHYRAYGARAQDVPSETRGSYHFATLGRNAKHSFADPASDPIPDSPNPRLPTVNRRLPSSSATMRNEWS